MFDIGFGELLLVFIIGLVVLGPQRLACGSAYYCGLGPRITLAGDNGAE